MDDVSIPWFVLVVVPAVDGPILDVWILQYPSKCGLGSG